MLQKGKKQKEAMIDIREEEIHQCTICDNIIYNSDAEAYMFAHVLAKWMYPKYRELKSNIMLVCSIDCHNELDKVCTGEKRQLEEIIYNREQVYKYIKQLQSTK